MKKIFAFILMSLVICVNANANDPYRYLKPMYHSIVGASVGFCSYFEHGTGIAFSCEMMGISVEGSFAGMGNYRGENQYGSGGLSNDYRVSSCLVGYIGYIQCGNNVFLSINPKVGIFEESRLYNDMYYGSDVGPTTASFEGGLDIGLNINNFTVKVGATNKKINIQMGAFFDIGCPIFVKDSHNKKSTSSYYNRYEYDIDVYDTNNEIAEQISYRELTDSEILEAKYHNIENQIRTNKKQMRDFSKTSIEYKVRKEENKTLKEQMNKIDEEYFELTGRYIYNGGEN